MIRVLVAMQDMQAADQQVHGFGAAVEPDNVHGTTWTTTDKVTDQLPEAAAVLDTLKDALYVIQFVHVSA
jgi:DnaJ-domain-containing protein 1